MWGSPPTVLSLSDAAAAIIRTPDGKFLLQLRDAIPNIWYPASWGCFGGALDQGETPIAALQRELEEELELSFTQYTLVNRLEFDLRSVGLGKYFREYYLIEPTNNELAAVVLHEGEQAKAFSFEEMASITLTPYDAFAMHLYWMKTQNLLAGKV